MVDRLPVLEQAHSFSIRGSRRTIAELAITANLLHRYISDIMAGIIEQMIYHPAMPAFFQRSIAGASLWRHAQARPDGRLRG